MSLIRQAWPIVGGLVRLEIETSQPIRHGTYTAVYDMVAALEAAVVAFNAAENEVAE